MDDQLPWDPAALPRKRDITGPDFFSVDLRIGTVIDARPFPEARKPALQLEVDFGPVVGVAPYDTFDEAVALADRVLVLEDGAVVHTLDIEDTRRSPGDPSPATERYRAELLEHLGVQF